MTSLVRCSTLKAPFHYNHEQIMDSMKKNWFSEMPDTLARASEKIFFNSQIKTRASVLTLDQVFEKSSFEERNNTYKEQSIKMGTEVLKNALNKAGWLPKDLDIIVTTSCTGFMIPSVDAYIIENLGLKQNILRLPVTEMGCAAGISGLSYLHQMMKGSKLKAALISVELPSLTFQRYDYSLENIISTAIFADGASCMLLSGEDYDDCLKIKNFNFYHFPSALHLMGYQLTNNGLKIILDREVPSTITAHLPIILKQACEAFNLNLDKIDEFLFHPGGKKIVQAAEEYISQWGKNLHISKKILEEHGNMSSSTILYILEDYMNKHAKENKSKGKDIFTLAFGPGFSAQSLHLTN